MLLLKPVKICHYQVLIQLWIVCADCTDSASMECYVRLSSAHKELSSYDIKYKKFDQL